MNKTNLSEITKIRAIDNSSIYDNGITEKLNRYKMLTVIKDCIVNGNFCKKLISDEYTAKDLIQHFIRQVDENYNYRSDTRTLEFDQSRFSSFLIVHIATVNDDIKNQTYECFVYLPTDMSKKIRLIITPEIDKNVDNKYELMSDAIVSLLEQNTNLRLDRDTVSSLLTLCDEAIHMPDIDFGKKYCNANKAINGIKKTLSYGKYSINYTKEYNESLRSEELKKEIRKTIDDFVREQPIVQQDNTEESLSSELTKLVGCCAYNTIALIFGYYLSSLFYKPYCRNALSYEEGVFPLKNRYVLNLYCTSKQSNGLYSIVRKLNNIFYDTDIKFVEFKKVLKRIKNGKIEKDSKMPLYIEINKKKNSDEYNKIFKKLLKDHDLPVIVISKSKIEEASEIVLHVKINKIKNKPLNQHSQYPKLKQAIQNFREEIRRIRETYNDKLPSLTQSTSYIKDELNQYYENKSAMYTMLEDKNACTAIYFLEQFFGYCVAGKMLTKNEANELLKKLLEAYFEEDVPQYAIDDDENNQSVDVEQAANILLSLIGSVHTKIPESKKGEPINTLPCITTINKTKMLLFSYSDWSGDIINYLSEVLPDCQTQISQLQYYFDKTVDAKRSLNSFLNDKGLVKHSSKREDYSYNSKTYFALIDEAFLKYSQEQGFGNISDGDI